MADREPQVAILVDYLSYHGRCIVRGLGNYLRLHGHWTIYGEPKRLALPLKSLRTWRGDGIIAQITDRVNLQQYRAAARRGIDVVDVAGLVPDIGLPQVISDSIAIGRMAAEHFIERGYKNLGFSGTPGLLHSDQRLAGFRQAAQQAKIDIQVFNPHRMHRVLGINEADDQELTRWVLSLTKPCGVMALSDGRARQLAEACHRASVRVPDQIAIIGVDNDEIICELMAPRLSSVAVPTEQIGYAAADMLAALMAGNPPDQQQVLIPPTAVAERYSTAALAIEDPDVAAALRLMRENRGKPYNVDQLLRELPVSRRRLEMLFRKFLGCSPHQEIERLRLAYAQRLLAETDWPIPQVAERCGYNSLAHFSHMFRKKCDVPPSAYRRRYRVADGDLRHKAVKV